jgi:hypothetical protein
VILVSVIGDCGDFGSGLLRLGFGLSTSVTSSAFEA